MDCLAHEHIAGKERRNGRQASAWQVHAEYKAEAVRQEQASQSLTESGIRPTGGSPEDLDHHLQGEARRWAEVIKAQNIRAD